MAVKKKSTAKKVAKKAPARKKAAAKKVTKKVTKKATKKVAKKAPARKKAAVKKVTKKVAKKAPARKKAAAKKTVKKAPAKKSADNKILVPQVPFGGTGGSSRVNVTTMPTPKAAPVKLSEKPSAAPKQGTSPRVLIIAIIGIVLLAVIVIARPTSDSDTSSPAPTATATASESAAPEVSATATPDASAPATESVTEIAAPTRFIGNWKDSGKSVMVITWNAPSAMAGLTGYKFEVRSGAGQWEEAGFLPVDQSSIEFTKGSTDGSTSFRISSIYSDGRSAAADAFGFAGQFA